MKTKLKKTLVCIIIATTFLCGCGRDKNILISDDNVSTKVEEESPFDLDAIKKSGAQIDIVYNWGIENYDAQKCKIELEGDELVLDFKYNNAGPEFQAGIVIFIDGIAQKYSLNGEEGYIVPVDIKDGSEEETSTSVQLSFTPECVLDGKEHIMYIGSVMEPEFRVKEIDNIYGHNLKMAVQNTWKLIYDAKKSEVEVSTVSTNVPILDSISQRYIYEEQDGKITNKLKKQNLIVFEQDEKVVEDTVLDTSKSVFLNSVGGSIEKYRLCCMVNNEPYPAFNSCCYVDINVSAESMTQVEMDFSKIEVEEGSCMYVMLCPYSDDGMAEDNFMWDKSSTYTLNKGGNPNSNIMSEQTIGQADVKYDNSDIDKVKYLSDYLSDNICEKIVQIDESVVACVTLKEQKYVMDFLELTSGSILNSIEGYFNSNTVIDVVDNNIVVYEGESWSDDGSQKEKVYILNNEYELVETVSLSDPVTSIAYVVLPIQKKILYVDYYGDEWKSCLKEMDFDKGNKKTIMKFSNVSELESLTQMKVSNDEKSVYFIGDYADSENSREQFPMCIGMIDIDNKNYHVYHEAKETICIEENGAYFYDNRVEETNGKVLYIDNDGKLKNIQTKEQNADVVSISFDKKYFCSLNQNKAENETDYNTPFTLRMYDLKDGTIVYENEDMDISAGVLVFNEERIICGCYFGDKGLKIKSFAF